ncbi:sensor histidine kinase [Kutzneria buriramensis]|uniref:histidine kinase n=1 Tax=Kutzneria buriramensis TaxID=1045776 RepID=A0A3E0H2N3_9PSEU|nr:sensor histidine kinase [Kutzneria buriramensis]REH37051.1 signal transduction histidine kinase [Kutzneria buriramensis]
MFWVAVVVVSAAEVTNFARQPQPYGLWPLACLGVMVLAWPGMAWDPAAPVPRKLALLPFLAGMVGLSLLSPYNSADIWLLLALANCMFVFGLRVTVAMAACFVAFTFVDILDLPGYTVLEASIQSLVVIMLTVFVTGLASAVTEARRRRAETQRLLGELAEAHQELRAYADQVRELSVAEERARMAREMHDSVGHYLTVIQVGLTNAERFRDKRPEQAWAEVAQAKELTRDALAETRRWVRAMRPLALEGRTGSQALAELARTFDGTGIEVRFQVHGAELPLLGDTEVVLYRVLQEGLTNVLRHAGAQRAEATLSFSEDRVRLRVGDDGHGAPDLTRGFGLLSLEQRAESAGGVLVAGNAASGGFELLADLPVRRR